MNRILSFSAVLTVLFLGVAVDAAHRPNIVFILADDMGYGDVASHLKNNGYKTGVIGKWHLGLGFQKDDEGQWDWDQPLDYSPINAGFESSLVIPASLDFPPYVYIDGHRITGLPNRTQPAKSFPAFLCKGELGSAFSIPDCLDELTKRASGFSRTNAGKKQPFFLYFPLTAPHKPVLPHDRFEGATKLGPYGDFVAQVDWTVGQVMKWPRGCRRI